MKLVALVVMALMVSCQTRQPEKALQNELNSRDSVTVHVANTEAQNPLKVVPIAKDSSFQIFFDRFRRDSLFQLQRVIFPFYTLSWKPEDEDPVGELIPLEEWKILHFVYYDSFAVRETNAYTQEISDLGFETRVELRGVNNSLHINYIFINESGQYKLQKREEYAAGLNPWFKQ